jgi:hypothetical protein
MPTFKVSNRCPANNRKEEKQKGADTRKAPMDMFGNLFYFYKQITIMRRKKGLHCYIKYFMH